MQMLTELGFWCSEEELVENEALDMNRPNPLLLVDDGWFSECDPVLLETVKWYLTRAFVESYELAYSFCRFSTCSIALKQPRVMGACTMTDGVYCWPEGYWHYVSHHHVKPPQEFLDHVVDSYDMIVEMTKKAREAKKLLLWDGLEHKAIDMPQAMQDWITRYTTIQVH